MTQRVIFYSEYNFEPWDWSNSIERGIGGSETSHVEMAYRLARRGYEVISYAPVPWQGTRTWRGTTWTHTDNADFSLDGLWIIYRVPHALDKFGPKRDAQPRWLMCQDTHYGAALSEERAGKLDRILALCSTHARHLASVYPSAADMVWQTTNGVKVELLREIEAEGIVRNPRRLIYASSPDRGLATLLRVFKRARELVPDLTLDVYYGFNNIEKIEKDQNPWAHLLAQQKREVLRLADQPGVTLRGRVDQPDLYRAWLGSGLWVYPTDFTETSCITCMEAQAAGAIPVFRPLWALADNVGHGVVLEGSPSADALVQARYVAEVVRLTRDDAGIALQEHIRGDMMKWARHVHNWERVVDQWDCDLSGLPSLKPSQFCFQFKHKVGRVLNVGCGNDVYGLREDGAVNVDVREADPIHGRPNRVDVIHDARNMFPVSLGQFDTVILGDIMEHIPADDWALVLQNCRGVLPPGGRLIITCPDDGDRAPRSQHQGSEGNEEYAARCSAFHTRRISREDILAALARSGFREVLYQPLDYALFPGHAVLAEAVGVWDRGTIFVDGRVVNLELTPCP